MEKSRQPFHDQENRYCQSSESSKYEEEAKASTQTPHAEADVDHHGPEHLRELCQEKGERGLISEHSARMEGCYSLLIKQKLKSNKIPLQWGGKLKKDNSFCSQVCQDVTSNCCTQRGAESLLSSSLFYSLPSTPPLPFSRALCKQTLVFTLNSSQWTHTQLCPFPAVLDSWASRGDMHSCLSPAACPARSDTRIRISVP